MINTSAILQANSIKELQDFIVEFRLRNNGIVCFNASIEFEIFDTIVKKDSEIQIITSDNFHLVYLMSDGIESFFLPDIFNCSSEIFEYVKNKCLKIHTLENEKYGAYTAAIFPKIAGI